MLTRLREYKRLGERAHRARRFKRRDKMFRSHDNIVLRLLEQRSRDGRPLAWSP
jgi:hypothetical protein